MKKLVSTAITMACSGLGWWIGAQINLVTALFLSIVGIGLGMYLGRQLPY
jgi:hypothetical protein